MKKLLPDVWSENEYPTESIYWNQFGLPKGYSFKLVDSDNIEFGNTKKPPYPSMPANRHDTCFVGSANVLCYVCDWKSAFKFR